MDRTLAIRVLRTLRIALIVSAALAIAPLSWLFIAYNREFRQCVQLGNGLNLGYEAVFDLSSPFFEPIAVPRYADGSPLVRDDMWPIYVTDTTLYGFVLGPATGPDHWIAWRIDEGLVRRSEEPSVYDRIVSVTGPRNYGVFSGTIGTGALLNRLAEQPNFTPRRCPTRLVTW